MKRDPVAVLEELRPQDLWPAWRVIDLHEQMGYMSAEEAKRWKEGIYGLMMLWGIKPEDLIDPCGTADLGFPLDSLQPGPAEVSWPTCKGFSSGHFS